jgi:hypothetical protein
MQKIKILLGTICLLATLTAAQAAEFDQVQDLYNREPLLDLDLPATTDTATPATETTPQSNLNTPTNVNPVGQGGAIETKPATQPTATTQPATKNVINPNVPPFNGGVISNPFVESTPVVVAQPILSFIPQANQIASFSYASYLKGGSAKAELSQTGPVATNLAIAIGMLALSFVAYRKNKNIKHNA